MTIGDLLTRYALEDIRRRRQLAMFPELPQHEPPCIGCAAGDHSACSGDLDDDGPCGCACREG